MVLDLIHHPKVTEFCSFIKQYNFNQKAKVVGVDVGDEYLGLKLYTELQEVPSSKIAENFLGTNAAQEFLNYAAYWDKTRESSLAFGIKIDSNGRERKYFHVKFAQCFDLVKHEDKFVFLKFLKINPKTLLKGISYEIESDGTYFDKFYLYIRNPADIAKIVLFKKINCDIKDVEELELYATSDIHKINVINFTDHTTESKSNVWTSIPEKFHQKLKDIAGILNSQPIYAGLTNNNIYSAYYSLTFQKENIFGI